jgi:hypothetical protein
MRGEDERGGAEDGDTGAALDETAGVLQWDKQRSFGKEAVFLQNKKVGGIGGSAWQNNIGFHRWRHKAALIARILDIKRKKYLCHLHPIRVICGSVWSPYPQFMGDIITGGGNLRTCLFRGILML